MDFPPFSPSQFFKTFLTFEFGGGPFGYQEWVFQHAEDSTQEPVTIIIHLPSLGWRTDDLSKSGTGLTSLRQQVLGSSVQGQDFWNSGLRGIMKKAA